MSVVVVDEAGDENDKSCRTSGDLAASGDDVTSGL
jgi:hypothetical protein